MENILLIIKKPKNFFGKMERNRIQLFPFLLIIIMYIISTFITKNIFADYLKDMIFTTENMTPSDLEYIIKNQTIISFIINPGLPILGIIVKAYLINGISAFDGHGEFKDALNVVSYSYIAVAFGNLIQSVLSVLLSKYGFRLTITNLLNLNQSSYASQILNEITPFVVYYQILVVIGIAILYQVNYKRSLIFVVGTWATWLLIISGIRTISF